MSDTDQNAPPIVWSVSGSDSGAGAGVQADVLAFNAFAVHGCTAVAALTAQNSQSVQRIEAVSAVMLNAQLAALASDMPPAAIKTGMLGSVENLRVLVRWVDRLRKEHPDLPLVVDPVLRASSGAGFVDAELLEAYRSELIPRATLITPNRAEAAQLLNATVDHSAEAVEQAAHALVALGCPAVVITGGDDSLNSSDDFALTPNASGWLTLPQVRTLHHHGTGCVFASSAAAAMARGFVPIEALILAKMATTHALRHGHAAGQGAGPVRPREDFAQPIANLPWFSLEGRSRSSTQTLDFAPLIDTNLGLYAVVDSADWVQRVLDAGVRTVQLRIKDPYRSTLRDEIARSVVAARRVDAQLFINDHWQLAIEANAYGVHLGQEDLADADLSAIAASGLRLGISTHSYWEVCRAWAIRPSYIACGPIHATQAKAMPWLPQGNVNLAYWCSLLPLPVVAIAGMNVNRVSEAIHSGASGVAVISAITAADSPEAVIDALLHAVVCNGNADQRPPFLPHATLQRTFTP